MDLLSKCQGGCVGEFHGWFELRIVYLFSRLAQQLLEELLPSRIAKGTAEASTNERNRLGSADQFSHGCQPWCVAIQDLARYVSRSSHVASVDDVKADLEATVAKALGATLGFDHRVG